MNLKEAFRYQNKLQSFLDEAQGILDRDSNVTRVENTYLRHKVMAEAEDETVLAVPETEYYEQITDIARFLLFLLDSSRPFLVGGILYACSLGKILPHSAVSLPHILKLWGLLTLPGPIQIRVGGLVQTKQGNAHIKAQASLLVRCDWGLVAFRLHQPFCFFVSVIPQGQRGKQLQATFVGLELRKLPGTRHLSPVLQGSRGVILLQMVKGLGKKVGMFRLLRQGEKVC